MLRSKLKCCIHKHNWPEESGTLIIQYVSYCCIMYLQKHENDMKQLATVGLTAQADLGAALPGRVCRLGEEDLPEGGISRRIQWQKWLHHPILDGSPIPAQSWLEGEGGVELVALWLPSRSPVALDERTIMAAAAVGGRSHSLFEPSSLIDGTSLLPPPR